MSKKTIILPLLIILAGTTNFLYLSPPVVNWDEGTHGLWGYWVWLALREGNFGHFLALMRTQFAYPPIGSLTIALTNLPFAFSMQLARFASTIGFIVSGVLIYFISKQLNATVYFLESKPLKTLSHSIFFKFLFFLILNSYYLILFFFLTSPAILFYSVTVFKESWGLALTLLVIFLYFRALKIKSSASFLLVGLSLILLFLEKYNYAILLAVALAMEAGVELLSKVGSYGRRQMAIFLPVMLFATWWILTPDNKLNWFMEIMRSDWNPVTVGVGSKIEYLLFYVNSLRVSYVFSEVLFWILLAGYFLAIKDLGNKKIRFLWVFFTINLVLGTMHSINLQDRYIYTAVPALFLLGGYEINQLVSRYQGIKVLKGKVLSIKYLVVSIILIFLIRDVLNFPTLLKSNASHMLLSAMYNETDYKDTLFDFDRSHWPGTTWNKKQLTGNKIGIETPNMVYDYILDSIDVNKPIEIVGHTSELSPDWFRLRVELFKKYQGIKVLRYQGDDNGVAKYLVTIEVRPESRLYTYDYRRANSWQLGKIREIEKQYQDSLLKEKNFADLGVGVRIYGL